MTEEEANGKWPLQGRVEFRVGHSKGYTRCLCPKHPNADKTGSVYEHVYRASLALGRGLKRGEVVHHIDGNPANNKNSNLLVCSHAYHRQLHERLARSSDWPQFLPRKTNRPTCSLCGIAISYGSKTGKCVTHYFSEIRSFSKPCRVAGCPEKSGFRSGLCLSHVRHRANKRRFERSWDYDGGI